MKRVKSLDIFLQNVEDINKPGILKYRKSIVKVWWDEKESSSRWFFMISENDKQPSMITKKDVINHLEYCFSNYSLWIQE